MDKTPTTPNGLCTMSWPSAAIVFIAFALTPFVRAEDSGDLHSLRAPGPSSSKALNGDPALNEGPVQSLRVAKCRSCGQNVRMGICHCRDREKENKDSDQDEVTPEEDEGVPNTVSSDDIIGLVDPGSLPFKKEHGLLITPADVITDVFFKHHQFVGWGKDGSMGTPASIMLMKEGRIWKPGPSFLSGFFESHPIHKLDVDNSLALIHDKMLAYDGTPFNSPGAIDAHRYMADHAQSPILRGFFKLLVTKLEKPKNPNYWGRDKGRWAH